MIIGTAREEPGNNGIAWGKAHALTTGVGADILSDGGHRLSEPPNISTQQTAPCAAADAAHQTAPKTTQHHQTIT